MEEIINILKLHLKDKFTEEEYFEIYLKVKDLSCCNGCSEYRCALSIIELLKN